MIFETWRSYFISWQIFENKVWCPVSKKIRRYFHFLLSLAYPIDRLDWSLFSAVIVFYHWFPLLDKIEIRAYILPRNFPAVLIIFTGRGRAGNPPFPTVRDGAGNPPLPAGRGAHPWSIASFIFQGEICLWWGLFIVSASIARDAQWSGWAFNWFALYYIYVKKSGKNSYKWINPKGFSVQSSLLGPFSSSVAFHFWRKR